MERCSCYHFYQGAGVFYSDGVCYGTKEREPCSCGGDPAKCDFYPEKRKAAICDLYDTQSKQCEPYKPCICPYDGDTSKCTFDDMTAELHKTGEIILSNKENESLKKLLNTAEMWLEAQKTGDRYECVNSNIAYSKDLGIVIKDDRGISWELLCMDGGGGARSLDNLLGEYQWEMTEKPISISEAEKLLERRIIVD